MRSAVLQFLLAGALVVAWVWMLGRPLLTMLARRSRRDSVGHFRYQQAALGPTVGVDRSSRWSPTMLLRPFIDWRNQPLEQRRLQVLLGFAIATFASAFLAIALRGSYISLFLIMTVGFAIHLGVAAWIGSRELQARDAELRLRSIDVATREAAGRVAAVSTAGRAEVDDDPYEIDDLLAGEGLGGGLFDEGFFEPIPELDRQAGSRPGNEGDAAEAPPDETPERSAAVAATDDRDEPTFTSPPVVRTRSNRRPKGRPIYIEPEPGETVEGDGTVRAVND